MLLPDWAVLNAAIDWLANGLWNLSWWQIVLYTLATTHITIASVTIFLHRAQAHRAMDLHPIPSHFFRFWLWLTTGMVTKEWVAIHRKHHAKCETVDDPHSPQTRGIETVLWRGAELYRAEAKNPETIAKFGHGTPDDWIERNLYTRYSWEGVGLMLILNVALFGVAGLSVWAVQMAWIPITAAGIINGIGHYWGYRNFEAPDASTNVSPWGLIIGGEELHNNHHTYPTAAKFSVKKYEFDIGWIYISLMSKIGWATVKKVPPKLQLGAVKPVADEKTLEALIANRYEVMAGYAREMRRVCKAELAAAEGKAGRPVAPEGRQALAAPRRRAGAGFGPAATGPGPSRPSGARQDGHHARGTAPDVAQHLELARAARRPTCRPGAAGPRRAASSPCSSSRMKLRAARA